MTVRAFETPEDSQLAATFARLNPECVLDSCREQLSSVDPAQRKAWTAIRVIEALYHPHRYARIAYALLSDPTTPSNRVWPESEIVYLHTPVREPMSRRGMTVTIDGQDMEAFLFPNDRRLRGLRKFSGTEDAMRVWQAWIAGSGEACHIHNASLQRQLLRYVPEHKWVIRLRAEVTQPGTDRSSKKRIAVRCASESSCRKLLHRHTVVSSASHDAGGAFFVPRVIGADVDNGILAVEWNRGELLFDLLRAGSSVEILGEVVKAIALFHRTRVSELEAITPDTLWEQVQAASNEIALAYPSLVPQLGAILQNLQSSLIDLSCEETVTLHNDLHVGQVKIKRDRVAILDLERMAIGDPLIDVANFSMQLRMLGYRADFDVSIEDAKRWADEFVDAWACQAGDPIDPIRFRFYAARSLINLSHGMVRHLRIGSAILAQRCLETAEEEVLSSPSTKAVAP